VRQILVDLGDQPPAKVAGIATAHRAEYMRWRDHDGRRLSMLPKQRISLLRPRVLPPLMRVAACIGMASNSGALEGTTGAVAAVSMRGRVVKYVFVNHLEVWGNVGTGVAHQSHAPAVRDQYDGSMGNKHDRFLQERSLALAGRSSLRNIPYVIRAACNDAARPRCVLARTSLSVATKWTT